MAEILFKVKIRYMKTPPLRVLYMGKPMGIIEDTLIKYILVSSDLPLINLEELLQVKLDSMFCLGESLPSGKQYHILELEKLKIHERIHLKVGTNNDGR